MLPNELGDVLTVPQVPLVCRAAFSVEPSANTTARSPFDRCATPTAPTAPPVAATTHPDHDPPLSPVVRTATCAPSWSTATTPNVPFADAEQRVPLDAPVDQLAHDPHGDPSDGAAITWYFTVPADAR
jgi:hypothetical protein